jgi:hypothetical protein
MGQERLTLAQKDFSQEDLMPQKPPSPLPDDDQNTQGTIDALNTAGVPFQRKTRYHFKVGPLNYYPTSGKIHIDGEQKARPEQGPSALIRELLTMKQRLSTVRKGAEPERSGSNKTLGNAPEPLAPPKHAANPMSTLTLATTREKVLQLRACQKRQWHGAAPAPFMNFNPTPHTRALENEIKEINQFLDQFVLMGGTHRHLVRIFNEGNDPRFDWNKGGRLYSQGNGTYQQLPKSDRLRMTIDDESICEIDIAASYLTIFHGWHDAPLDPAKDPYELTGLGPEARAIVKRWFIITFGTDGHFATWPPKLINHYHKARIDLQEAYPVSVIRQKAIERYPLLARWADADGPRWADLMYRESRAIIGAMLELMREHKVPSLAVHDSLIVPQSQRALAEELLKRNYMFSCKAEPKLVVHQHAVVTPDVTTISREDKSDSPIHSIGPQ